MSMVRRFGLLLYLMGIKISVLLAVENLGSFLAAYDTQQHIIEMNKSQHWFSDTESTTKGGFEEEVEIDDDPDMGITYGYDYVSYGSAENEIMGVGLGATGQLKMA